MQKLLSRTRLTWRSGLKKRTRYWTFLFVVCLFGNSLTLAQQEEVLHSQLSPLATTIVPSSSSIVTPLDTEAADDFTVPAGETWEITTVKVLGEFVGATSASSVTVIFYQDAGAVTNSSSENNCAPGPEFYSETGIMPINGLGDPDFEILLSEALDFGEGMYWVVVVPDMGFFGEWGWEQLTEQVDMPAHWQNPSGARGMGCTSFGPLPTCGFPHGDLAFELRGFRFLKPTVDNFTPKEGTEDTEVTITGIGFTGVIDVTFNGSSAQSFTFDSDTQVRAIVPFAAGTGPIGVRPPKGTGESSEDFRYFDTPGITSFVPDQGTVGTNVEVTGENLGGATSVAFNGTEATFTVVGETQIDAPVPENATTGPITVTGPGGTATSAMDFVVLQFPVVVGFTPEGGPSGTRVSITGAGFTGASQVTIGGKPAKIESVSEFQIEVTIPNGSPSGRFSVTTPAGIGESAEIFFVEVGGGNSTVNANNFGDPVKLFNGELLSEEPPDFELGGPLGLGFRRYYASFLGRDGRASSALGENWLHNFDWVLRSLEADLIEVVSDRGRVILFQKNGADWDLAGRRDIPFQLVESGSDFLLGDPRSQLIYTFDSSGKLTKIEDGKGNAHSLTYTGSHLTAVSDGLGRSLALVYDANGHLMSVSDGTRTVTFGYTGDNLTSVTDAAGNVTTYSYDAAHAVSGLQTGATQPGGNTPYSQTFDAGGRVSTQTDAAGHRHTFAYDTTAAASRSSAPAAALSARQTVVTDPFGNTQTFLHTASGEHTSYTDEAGKLFTIAYDTLARRTSTTDRLGGTTTATYHDPSARFATLTLADGASSTFSYTARSVNGLMFYDRAGATYADGTSESWVYDGLGNLTSWTDRAGKVTAFAYNGRGQVTSTTNAEGGVSTFTYSAGGTPATHTDPSGKTTTLTYDALSRLTSLTYPDGASQSFTYDVLDRPLTVTDERGNTTSFTYDANGNQLTRTDPQGGVSAFAYDGLNRLISATDPLGQTSRVTYDARGRAETLTDRNGNRLNLAYDARNRLVSVTDGAGNTATATHNDEGLHHVHFRSAGTDRYV